MRRWLRANWWAFLVIVALVAATAGTVTYKQWARQLGYTRPVQTVAAGQWGEAFGMRWRLSPVTVPSPGDIPTGGRLASYVLDRDRDGRPGGLPDGFQFCSASLVDGPRRWTTTATDTAVFMFAYRQHVTTVCGQDGPLLVAMYVPKDATISAVEVLFQPGRAPAPETDAEDANAPVFTSSDESPLVLRFQT
ncbi:hypothetical protein FK535_12375 [Mycolicibacterium sp. 018/SC-01/001]|uniref:hypothetical protein n=1 Tax=Mycolicibacterium sp. 018/SC-01/001 TaxID=2592069 RepID=UPI00117FFE93|nr:hypothetical protein [Mycolicibacterium sp. 018/SC-01/001]TRW82752.1 hypothetical protein FK535_12375 [Mycolicibacterium sp. 018/SC-01/001]